MLWSGGPFSWLDIIGASKVIEIFNELTKHCGERFTTPKLLRKLTTDDESFYNQFDPSNKAAA